MVKKSKEAKKFVAVGFLAEGASDKILLDFLRRTNFFQQYNILVKAVIGGDGREKLISDLDVRIDQCFKMGAEKVIVLADMEELPCFTKAKSAFHHQGIHKVIIAKKALEAWFLADSTAMQKKLKDKKFHFHAPENTSKMPWNALEEEFHKRKVPFTDSKPAFAKQMVESAGFSITLAAEHPNCKSITYFLNTLATAGSDE
ncbi:MAG: DUF4276 family protein [Candidatus Kapabacteria bacterium]|jgi:hypothetical protein|nr:DUF4276 family protein [Candidatus Kapabacteria bacterium]